MIVLQEESLFWNIRAYCGQTFLSTKVLEGLAYVGCRPHAVLAMMYRMALTD